MSYSQREKRRKFRRRTARHCDMWSARAGAFRENVRAYKDIQTERNASTGKSCSTFGGLPPIRNLRWMKSEYESDSRAAKWSAVNVRNDKRFALTNLRGTSRANSQSRREP